MRILVAPDAFKGTLTAFEAAAAIADGVREALPEAEVVELPLADGGEGTAGVLAPCMGDRVCLIESAQLIGLNQPEMTSLDVMRRGSAPLGEVILAGLNAGQRDFVIGLGGSATNDGGLGMLMALGMQAFNTYGDATVEPNLSGLFSLAVIDAWALDPRLDECRITVLVDVLSPLCGKNGATAVYGPQKGIQAGDIDRIDDAMAHFALKCHKAFGSQPALTPGAGAAGGLGFALMLLGGEVVSGAEFVMNACGFTSKLAGADWVITGEGSSDAQTLAGKLPLKVAQAAREAGVKVALVAGFVDQTAKIELEMKFDRVFSVQSARMHNDLAMQQARSLLTCATAKFGRMLG